MLNKFIIAHEELKRIISYYKNVVITILFLGFFVVVPVVLFNRIIEELAVKDVVPIAGLVEGLYKFYVFSYLFSCAMFIIYTISMDTFISDKKEKALDVVLSTPMSLSDLWIGKTAALFTISYGASLVAAFGFAAVLSSIHGIWPGDWATFVYLFLVFPILTFSLIALGGVGQLISKRFTGVNSLLFFIAFFIIFVSSFLVERLLELNSTLLLAAYLGLALLLILVNYISYKTFFNKEKVVLT